MLRRLLQGLRRALLEGKGERIWTKVEGRELSDIEKYGFSLIYVRGVSIQAQHMIILFSGRGS